MLQKITVNSHAQNTTELQPKVFFNWNTSVTGHRKGQSAFPSANHCQGQLQTPQSLTVCLCMSVHTEWRKPLDPQFSTQWPCQVTFATLLCIRVCTGLYAMYAQMYVTHATTVSFHIPSNSFSPNHPLNGRHIISPTNLIVQ
jgi:hypothetical protein